MSESDRRPWTIREYLACQQPFAAAFVLTWIILGFLSAHSHYVHDLMARAGVPLEVSVLVCYFFAIHVRTFYYFRFRTGNPRLTSFIFSLPFFFMLSFATFVFVVNIGFLWGGEPRF